MVVVNEKPEEASLLDLEDQFAFYGQYHANKVIPVIRVNIGIHIICVPTIYWTSGALLNALLPYVLYRFPLDLGIYRTTVDITPTFLIGLGYLAYFILMEPIAGLLFSPILLGLTHLARVVQQSPGGLKIAGMIFVAAWLLQFVGHGVFEGRAPALLDSLVQSLVLAPFFVFMEVIFQLGYRPALHKRLQNRIGKNITAFRRQRAEERRKQAQ